MSVTRTRWAAIGAAVAISLGGGGLGFVAATSPSDAGAFVPITACRLADTRPAFQVGPRSTALGADDTYTVTAHGTNGECTIPSTATGLVMNVTAVGATRSTFLTFWDSGTRPKAANLNPEPGQPPTPNVVTTPLSLTGTFNVFNRFGSVDVVIDVGGYYTDHDHDDRYYTHDEVDAIVAALPTASTTTTSTSTAVVLAFDPTEVMSSSLAVPGPGHVTVLSTARIESGGPAGADHACKVMDRDELPISEISDPFMQYWEVASTTENERDLRGFRTFAVDSAGAMEFVLVCQKYADAGVFDAQFTAGALTAMFTPTP